MKKIFKILVVLFLGIIIGVSISGCNEVKQNELQNKIDMLQKQIDEMNDKLTEKDEQIRKHNDTIENLSEQIKNRDDRIEHLEKELAEKSQEDKEFAGSFFTLQEAYNKHWLTQADLMNIAYYHNGCILYPGSLSEETAKAIKKSWAEKLSKDNSSGTIITEEMVAINKYFGIYNKCAIIVVDRLDAQYPAIDNPITIEIGKVTFNFNPPRPTIVVWKM